MGSGLRAACFPLNGHEMSSRVLHHLGGMLTRPVAFPRRSSAQGRPLYGARMRLPLSASGVPSGLRMRSCSRTRVQVVGTGESDGILEKLTLKAFPCRDHQEGVEARDVGRRERKVRSVVEHR